MSRSSRTRRAGLLIALFLLGSAVARAGEDWIQLKYDGRRSGNVPERSVKTPLGLLAATPLTDAVFTAPAVAGGRVYVVDGSGTAFCLDATTLNVIWKRETRGGSINCNNISSPAISAGYVHFGTMGGSYYVLDAVDGKVIKEIACGEPILSAPVVANNRVYFATLGSQVHALEPNGTVCWTWDFVKEQLGFTGDRWSGHDWIEHKKEAGRVTWHDHFCCSRDLVANGKTLIVPAGGFAACLEDLGTRAEYRGDATVPNYKGSEAPATFGLSIGADGTIYRQWHRRDNSGRVEMIRFRGGKLEADYVLGTLVRNDMPGLLSFSSVSLRGQDVYRCRPEEGFGCSKHVPGQEEPQYLGGYPSITPPILLRNQAVYGGLDGALYVVPLSGDGKVWSFKTGFGKAITAPAAVCDGRIYFGCEDGYVYALGSGGAVSLPTKDLQLWKIRSPLTGKKTDPKYDWFTNYGNLQNVNANDQAIKPPFRIKWIRRYQGTFKHLPVCGGGRMYTHTAEGQIFAIEQETGRLLWRRYWPGVHVSYTSPIYYGERLLVPQAGLKRSRLRCLDAATGKLLWEGSFTGSPSWSRQQPPVIWKNLAIYMFGTGKYAPKGTSQFVFRGQGEKATNDSEETMSWLYSHDNPRYPVNQKPLVRAWDIETGKVVWTKDFSEFGYGGDDAGLCLMDDTLYYSCFFGYAAIRRGAPGPKGITAAMDPATGRVIWSTNKHSVTAGCTISGENGRLYLGGYNAFDSKKGPRHVWCLDARNGSLIWESEPLVKSINVVAVAPKFLFTFAYGNDAYLIDKNTGKIISTFKKGYACTRFGFSEPYAIGPNLDMIDTSNNHKTVSSGPPVDVRDCVGGIVSNGRLFYTAQASGLQVSQACGAEAASGNSPWQPAPAN